MVPVVSFVGRSNSGKTTLLEKVIKKLKLGGYRVAVIKHSHHDFDWDQKGKDTWRFVQAGSNIVTFSSPTGLVFIEHRAAELTLTQVLALIGNKVDIVLTEGYKECDTDKIWVLTPEGNEDKSMATIRAHLPTGDTVELDYNDVDSVVNLLKKQIEEPLSCRFGNNFKTSDLESEDDEHQTSKLDQFLSESVAFHGHVCPGQMLGIRMAIRGCRELGIELPRVDNKRLIVYVEIDRCATDAIQIVTGCKLGKRTMKYLDYGKLAATFVDLYTGNAVRLGAREDAREKASRYQRPGWTRHQTEAFAYRIMPEEELFHLEHVLVQIPAEDMPGQPLRRVMCSECGETVNDGREVILAERVLCLSCAYGRYYQPVGVKCH